MALHSGLTDTSLHVSHAFTFANAAARAAGTGYTIVSGDKGKIAMQTDTARFYILTNHSPITWSEVTVPSNSGGGINYVTNPSAADSTTGWATFADAAGNIPVDGTGGSPNSTLTRTTSAPLRDGASFLWTKSGSANRQGEGFSWDFTIDPADQGKVLAVGASYIVASGTFTASDGITVPKGDGTTSTNAGNSDLQWAMYDVTNAVLIPVTPAVFTSNSSGVAGTFKGTFQSPTNSTSLRLIVYTATATTNNFTVKFADFSVGPQSVINGVPMSDWTSYALTIGATTTAPTKGTIVRDEARWRRVGDSMEIHYDYEQSSGGTGGTGTYLFPLPTGYQIDTAKQSVGDSSQSQFVVGNAVETDGSTKYAGSTIAYTSTQFALALFNEANAIGNVGSGFRSMTNANERYSFRASVPILGWSSNVQMSADAETRVVAARYSGTDGGAISNATSTNVNYTTKNFDTHSAVTTGSGAWKFTAPVSGKYLISAVVTVDISTTTDNILYLFKNGAEFSKLIETTVRADFGFGGSDEVDLVAGDYIEVRAVQSNGTGRHFTADAFGNYIAISRIAGPAAVMASERVSIDYGDNGGQSITANVTDITWSTKTKDTHGAWSGTVFTAPAPGDYLINGSIRATSSAQVVVKVFKNGSDYRRLFTDQGSIATHTFAGRVTLVAGDTISIRVDASFTLESGSANNHWLTIGLAR